MQDNEPIILNLPIRASFIGLFYIIAILTIIEEGSVIISIPYIVLIIILVFSGFILNCIKRITIIKTRTKRYKASIKKVIMEHEKECCICLEPIVVNKPAVKLRCNHYYHDSCIFEWYQNNKTCPLCRENLCSPPVELTEINVI